VTLDLLCRQRPRILILLLVSRSGGGACAIGHDRKVWRRGLRFTHATTVSKEEEEREGERERGKG
jgi:hypothetical protein